MATTELKEPPFYLSSHNSARLPKLPSAVGSSAVSPPTSPPAGSEQQFSNNYHHHHPHHPHQVSSDIQVHSRAKHLNHRDQNHLNHHNVTGLSADHRDHVTAESSSGTTSRTFPSPVLGPLIPHSGKAPTLILSPEEAAAAAGREVNGNYYAHSANSGIALHHGSDPRSSKDCLSGPNDSSSGFNSSSELVLKMPGHAFRCDGEDSINGNPIGNNADDCEVPTTNGEVQCNCECDSPNAKTGRHLENRQRERDLEAVGQKCGLPYVVTDGALRSLSSSSSSGSSSLSCQKCHGSRPEPSGQPGSHVTFQIGENGGLHEEQENNALSNNHLASSSLSSLSSSAST
ncbi:hypothetical protein EGW08_007703, partial [Elysia chlorotica]